MGSLTRTPYGRCPQYHTSADDLDLITDEQLLSSLEMYLAVIGAYGRLLDTHRRGGADVTLGLFPGDQPERSDMVELEPDGTVRRLVIKRPDRGLRFTWSIAAWRPSFTEYLRAVAQEGDVASEGGELYVGDVVQRGLEDGLRVETEIFTRGASVDLGTPASLADPPPWVS